MNKKNFWIAVIGGFAAGIGACLLVCSLCCGPAKYGDFRANPPEVKMMHHHKGHFAHNGMHHKHHGFGRHGKMMREDMPKPHFDRERSSLKKNHFEPTPEMREHFAKKLGLTDEQKEKLEQFRQEDMAKMEPLINEMKELGAKMDQLREENKAHFESVLTNEQKEILQQMRHKRRK